MIFAHSNETMQMLPSAVRILGKEYFDDAERKRKVRDLLRKVSEKDFNRDIVLPPAWVGEIINEI